MLTQMLERGTRRRRPPAWRWTLSRDSAWTPWPRPPRWRRRGQGRGKASGGTKGAGPGNGRVGFFCSRCVNLEIGVAPAWRDFLNEFIVFRYQPISVVIGSCETFVEFWFCASCFVTSNTQEKYNVDHQFFLKKVIYEIFRSNYNKWSLKSPSDFSSRYQDYYSRDIIKSSSPGLSAWGPARSLPPALPGGGRCRTRERPSNRSQGGNWKGKNSTKIVREFNLSSCFHFRGLNNKNLHRPRKPEIQDRFFFFGGENDSRSDLLVVVLLQLLVLPQRGEAGLNCVARMLLLLAVTKLLRRVLLLLLLL